MSMMLTTLPVIKQMTFNMVNKETGKLLTLSTNANVHNCQPGGRKTLLSQASSEMFLEFRDLDQTSSQNQVWFFRYDCIVNQACPNIALEPSDKTITISTFTGDDK